VPADDRELIEEVLTGYTAHGDAGRVAGLAALFGDQGTLMVAGVARQGAPRIAEFLAGLGRQMGTAGGLFPGFHVVASRHIEATGPGEARSSSVFVYMAPGGADHWGTYRDRLARAGDRWEFVERRVEFTGFAPTSTARSIVDGLREQAKGQAPSTSTEGVEK